MTKIYITYHPSWADDMPSWAASKYSPDLSNSRKIQSNLSKLGHVDRFEWQQNMQLIKKAVAPFVVDNTIYIHVEKLTFAGVGVVLSMTINLPHLSEYFCGFILSATLNLDSIYFVEKIMNHKSSLTADEITSIDTETSLSDISKTSNNDNQESEHYNSIDNVDIRSNVFRDDKDSEDDDDPNDEKFLYALALKEPPKVTAEKAVSNGLEWYSFFLPEQDKEEIQHNDNSFVVSSFTPASIQRANK